jgi:CRISPR-associated exonuclease Cas4
MLVLILIGLVVGVLGSWLVYGRRRHRNDTRHLELQYEGPYKKRLRRALVSWEYGITGKPDYIVHHEGIPIPVLVKTGLAPEDSPHDSHVAQILAYCLLIHETAEVAPPYGIIRYADRTFEVDYNETSVQALLDLVAEIRSARGTMPPRSHDTPRRCAACRHHRRCNEALAHSPAAESR